MIKKTKFALHITEISLFPNIWSFICVCLIFASVYILNSNFMLMPGISISMPTTLNTTYAKTDKVLQVQSDDFMMLDEKFLSLKTLPSALKKSISNNKNNDTCLLIIVDKTIQLENFIRICDIAKSSGYTDLHLATSQKMPDEK